MRLFVKAKVTVPGIHQWLDAPRQFMPLRTPHRHLFTFELDADVTDPNRQIEFIDMGQQLRVAVDAAWPRTFWGAYDFGENSCEMLAQWALTHFHGAFRCTVWEDMENAGGAERVLSHDHDMSDIVKAVVSALPGEIQRGTGL